MVISDAMLMNVVRKKTICNIVTKSTIRKPRKVFQIEQLFFSKFIETFIFFWATTIFHTKFISKLIGLVYILNMS
jgi:hypothetical protein